MCAAGFASRKGPISLYIHTEGQEELLAKLGKFKTGKASCSYQPRSYDVDEAVLKKLLRCTRRSRGLPKLRELP